MIPTKTFPKPKKDMTKHGKQIMIPTKTFPDQKKIWEGM